MSDIILYTTDDGATKIDLRLENGTVWLTQLQIAELFEATKQNISLHLKNIFEDGELTPEATVKESLTVQTEGMRQVQRTIALYNLDMILAVGYRVRSVRGVQFRRWASTVLKEYLEKGFALNDERLKNLVSAYFDLAELNAIEQREMRMADYVRELDSILKSTGRKLLENAGKISTTQAKKKAKAELGKYKAKTLAPVEKEYLKTIASLEKMAKAESRKKGGKP